VNERKVEIERIEQEQRNKQTVVSKGPLRRLRSEIPQLEIMKKRAHSIAPATPLFPREDSYIFAFTI
jgi:hypothetical protein